MNKIIKYKNNIIFVLFIVLSISLIINSIVADFDDGIINFENKISKIEIFVLIDFWAVHYIYKIICRLKISRKKLFKSFIYFSEDIVQILKKAYQKKNYEISFSN